MEKKTLFTATFISVLLLSAVAGTQFIRTATANPNPWIEPGRYDSPPIVSIHSPANGSYVNSVLVNVTVTKSADWMSTPISFSYEPGGGLSQKLVSVSFQVDGKPCWAVRANSNLASPFNYSLHITDIADGSHTIVVRADSTGVARNWISSTVYGDVTVSSLMAIARNLIPSSVYVVPVDSVFATVHFTLDSTPPNVSFLSTEKAYATADFPLNFTVNEPVSKISYVLDGQENVTIAGNTTLMNLPYGEHNVTVYATDNVGNIGSSETRTFTIVEPQPEPFQTTLVVAPIASVVVVSVGILVYFKKRKR